MHHARMVRRLFSYIGEGGHVPHEWFAAEVARLDNMSGDIEALADRLAGIRSWAYIAHRADWLKEPAKWAERTREVEARLSRRAPRAADPALRRPPHRGAGPRHRRARRRRACRSPSPPTAKSASGPSRSAISPASSSASIRRPGSPTSACCSPPPSAASATSSTAAPSALVEAPTIRPSRWSIEDGGGLAVAWEGHVLARLAPGRSLLEPALRTARALDRLSAPTPRRASRAARALARRAGRRAICGRSSSSRRRRPIRRARRAFARSPRCWPMPAACCRARPCSAPSPHLEQADRQALHRLARPARPARRLHAAAAQARRAALARGAARGAQRPADAGAAARRAPRRSAPRPTRAAPRSPTAGSAAAGSASTSPTASPATPARSARPAATIRSTRRSRPRSASARRRSRG